MKMMKVLGVYREQRFSPGKVKEDAAILDATLAELARFGHQIARLHAESIGSYDKKSRPDIVLTMAQCEEALRILEKWTEQGARVVNSVGSVRNCYRKPLVRVLEASDAPIPQSRMVSLEEAFQGVGLPRSARFWLKRGDVHAMQEGDVVSVASDEELSQALRHFRAQGIQDILIQEHIAGDVIKFYAVGPDIYFRAFSAESGEPITARMAPLAAVARQAAIAAGLEVYGGDAVVTPKDEIVLIDLNDWPSFSRCCLSAAQSVASYLMYANGSAAGGVAVSCGC